MAANRSLRILLVDDMPAMRKIYRTMLEESGFTHIDESEDAEGAWKQVQIFATAAQDPYGLIIADWNMPGFSGVDLLRAIRNSPPTRQLPFLMVTARGSQAHVLEAMQAGASDYVVKPFTSGELSGKIDALFTEPLPGPLSEPEKL